MLAVAIKSNFIIVLFAFIILLVSNLYNSSLNVTAVINEDVNIQTFVLDIFGHFQLCVFLLGKLVSVLTMIFGFIFDITSEKGFLIPRLSSSRTFTDSFNF